MLPPAPDHLTAGLFGRKAELERLYTFAAKLEEPDARGAILVTGAAGVGKTRLLDEARRLFRKQGALVLEAHCKPGDNRPNGVFVDLFARGVELLEDAGHRAPLLDRAINRLAGLADPVDSTHSHRGDELLQLCETVRRALLHVAIPQSPVILIHDLHWADDTTIAVLRFLLENLLTDPVFDWVPPETEGAPGGSPVFRGLVIASFRTTKETRPLLDVASATEAIDEINLQGLDLDGTREYLQSPKVVEYLHRTTHGNPQALENLLSAIPSETIGLDAHAGPTVTLSEAAILDVLAVVDSPCTAGQIRSVGELESDLRSELDSLTRRGVIRRSVVDGRPSYSFKRPAESLNWATGVAPERQRQLHARIAERLAHSFDAEPERIARHFLAADARADAVPYAIEAAERLRAGMVYGRAAELLEQIVEVTEEPLHGQIQDTLASLYAATGDVERAQETLESLAELRPGDAARFKARFAELLLGQGKVADAQRVAEDALTSEGATEVAVRLSSLAADCAYRLGELSRAEELCAILLDEELVDAHGLALRNTLGKVHLFREEFDEAHRLFKQNLEAATAADDATHQAKALINLGVVQLQKGAPELALSRFETARQLCEQSGDLASLSISLENLAVLHHRRQAYGDAFAYYHQSTAASRRLGLHGQLTTSALNLADLYLVVGDLERARRLAEIAREYIRRGPLRFLETQSVMLDGDLARAEGDHGAAATHYARAIEQIERGEQTNQRLGYLLWNMAELHLEQEEAERAQHFIEQVLELPAPPSESLAIRLRLTQGGIFMAQGDTKRAIAELEAAVLATVENEDREAVWQARFRLARAYFQNDQSSQAQTAMARSLEVIERVAAELPPSLRRCYRQRHGRAAVREGLRRIKAGLSPIPERTSGEVNPPPRSRPSGGTYNPVWAKRYGEFIGKAPSLFPVFNALDRVSGSDSMVLIRGESGTGKELVAAALHKHSPRAERPFVKVNCAAFVETLLLSELFGHEKGAFTGAVNSKKGRFELANGGTLFLDEIGDISANTQVALLRVLQERAFERVGGQETVAVDVRVICATHRNLEKMVEDGTFRADLYYRLRGIIIELPPLRDRPSDIPLLVDFFLREAAHRRGRESLRFDRRALASMVQHSWPGNVRELENVVRSAALFADGETIGLAELAELGDILQPPSDASILTLDEILDSSTVQHTSPALSAAEKRDGTLPEIVVPEALDAPTGSVEEPGDIESFDWLEKMIGETGSLTELKKRIEYEAIAGALRAEKGNITRAAKRLGMKRPRLSQIIHGNSALGALKDQLMDT